MTKRQKHRDVARFLRSHGWEIDRINGSHEIWKSEDGTMTLSVAPHAGEVSVGIVKQIKDVFPDTPKNWN